MRVPSTAERAERQQGEASIDLPAGAAHSFEAEHNQIRWRLRVRGDVRSWPDIDDVFEIVVLPARMPAGGQPAPPRAS